jgi:hypothetical protein
MEFYNLANYLILGYSIILFIIHLIFLICSDKIEEISYENIFNTLESSPLFNFEIKESCGGKSNVIFHVWGGWEILETTLTYYNGKSRTHLTSEIIDRTNIEKINGNKYCYKLQTYRDLLYNGQIIKENENCKDNYKSCGIIDTLNQKLCVSNSENCPLKDIYFGQINSIGYTYDPDLDISYNNENYEGDEKIIGSLILNDGQPCLSVEEKLWRKFHSDEAGDGHLQCENTLDGIENDQRYKAVGEVTYKSLYSDNLSEENKKILLGSVGSAKVTLYKREFLGIDKNCDEKFDMSDFSYDQIKNNHDRLKVLYIFEIIFIIFISCGIFFVYKCNKKLQKIFYFNVVSCIFLPFFVIVMVCNIIFFAFINKNYFAYDCSDEITNEFLKKQYKKTKKIIIYAIISLVFDFLGLVLIIILCIKKKQLSPSELEENVKEQNANVQNANVQNANVQNAKNIQNAKNVQNANVQNNTNEKNENNNNNIHYANSNNFILQSNVQNTKTN